MLHCAGQIASFDNCSVPDVLPRIAVLRKRLGLTDHDAAGAAAGAAAGSPGAGGGGGEVGRRLAVPCAGCGFELQFPRTCSFAHEHSAAGVVLVGTESGCTLDSSQIVVQIVVSS